MPHPLIPPQIPPGNVTQSPRDPHVEIMNTQTLDVWLCQEPMTKERYKALALPAPFIKSGRGVAMFDFAYFRRSPGAAADGALEAMDVDGTRFVRVARPQALKGFAAGNAPTSLFIEKHHVIGFDAGATLRLARLPDGQYYVQQTATAGDLADVDPEDWAMHTLTLERAWSVELAYPTTVWFFRNLRSFCGPFRRDQLPAAPLPIARSAA